MAETLPRLVPIAAVSRAAFLAYARATREGGDDRYAAAETDYDAWLAREGEWARGEKLKPERMPTELLCLVLGERVLGACRLRPELNEGLLDEGGHVGYEIRPSERGQGFGTLILRLVLEDLRWRGVDRVRVTCDDDNLVSARVIERNGGLLDDKGPSDESGKVVRRYWIDSPAD